MCCGRHLFINSHSSRRTDPCVFKIVMFDIPRGEIVKLVVRQHGAMTSRVQLYTWLGAGALTVGVGAALTSGAGTAHADSTATTTESRSAISASTRADERTRPKAHTNKSHIITSAVRTAATVTRPTKHMPRTKSVAMGHAVVTAAAPTRTSSVVPPAAATASAQTLLRRAANTVAVSEKDQIDLAFSGLNSTIGWIPGLGTAVNGFKFGIDALSLAASVVTFNVNQSVTELGNLVVDTIGLVPVVGGPLASLLYQTVLGGNIKLGSLVQASMQSYLASNSPWSQYQFLVEGLQVSVGNAGLHAGIATVSTPTNSGGVMVDITNTGFELGYSIPLEGRLQLLALAFS